MSSVIVRGTLRAYYAALCIACCMRTSYTRQVPSKTLLEACKLLPDSHYLADHIGQCKRLEEVTPIIVGPPDFIFILLYTAEIE